MNDLNVSQQVDIILKKPSIVGTVVNIHIAKDKFSHIVRYPLLWLLLDTGEKITTANHFESQEVTDRSVHRKALELRLDLLSRSLSDPQKLTSAAVRESLKSAKDDEKKTREMIKVLFCDYLTSPLLAVVDTPSNGVTAHHTPVDTHLVGVVTEIFDTDKGWLGNVTSYQPPAVGYQFDKTSPMWVDSQLGTYPLHIGDEVSFSPLDSDQSVVPGTLQVTKYNTCLEDDFVRRYFEWISSSENNPLECLTKLLSCPAPFVCALSKEETYSRFCTHILAICKICTLSPDLAIAPKEKHEMLKMLSNSCFIQNVAHHLDQPIDTTNIEQSLCIAVDLLSALVIAKAHESHALLAKPLRDMTKLLGDKNKVDLLQQLMMSLLDTHYTPTTIPMTTTEVWQSISTIPHNDELKEIVKHFENGNSLSPHLPKVKATYSSAVEYGHTYFSLLRADCYHPLCEKIAQLKKAGGGGNKLSRDYYKMTFTELITVVPRPILFGFRFECLHVISQEDDTPYLTKGNLLCLSAGGQFDGSFIWATIEHLKNVTFVLQKDGGGIIKKGTVHLQVCSDLNTLPDEECMEQLRRSKNIVAVESPAYFRAYQPVLDALKGLDLSKIHFLDTLLNPAEPTKNSGDLLASEVTPDPLFKSGGMGRTSVQQLIAFLNGADPQLLCLDRSQVKAVCQSMEYPISVIQGPPGTGKTYVGVKLMQLFLSLSSLPKDTPILIMAHKNRALDYFLDKCLSFCSNVVRIGRCSEGYKHLEPLLLYRQTKQSEKEKELEHHLQLMSERIKDTSAELQMKHMLKFENGIEFLPSGYRTSLLSQQQQQQLLIKRLTDNPEKYLRFLKCGMAAGGSGITDPADSELRSSLMRAWDEWTNEIHASWEEGTTPDQAGDQIGNHDDDDRHDWTEERKLSDIQSENINPDAASTIPMHFDFTAQENVNACNNAWKLSVAQRKSVIMKSIQDGRIPVMQTLRKCLKKYDEIREKYEFEKRKSELHVLQHARIVGMTTTGAAINQQLLNLLKAPVVFIEEAAEVLESNLLATLTPHVKHLILIGDHVQLKPWVAYSGSKALNFNKSLFERLFENKGFHYTMLERQSRMRPELVRLFSAQYTTHKNEGDNIHSNDEIVSKYKTPSCMATSLFWWSHNHEETKQGKSRINELEVKMVVSLCLWILVHGSLDHQAISSDDIVVLTPYRAQVEAISRALQDKHNMLLQSKGSLADDLSKLKVCTIDEYQSHEANIVILSLVRGNTKNQVGFLRERSRQVVAVSRQKCGLYIVGYTQFLHSASPKVWKPIIELCRREQSGCIESAIVVKTGHEGTHKCNSPEELEDLVYKNIKSADIFGTHERFKLPGRQYSSPPALCPPSSYMSYSEECLDMKVDDACIREMARTTAISKWRELGRCFELEEYVILKLEDRKDELDEKFIQMMIEWRKHVKDPTYKKLVHALNNCKLQDVISKVLFKYICKELF